MEDDPKLYLQADNLMVLQPSEEEEGEGEEQREEGGEGEGECIIGLSSMDGSILFLL